MRKLNIWGLPDEQETAPEVRTFTDERHPGEEFALCLARPGLLEQAAIQEVAEAYCREFLGEGEGGSQKGKGFLTPSGKSYRLNRGCIWEVSAVYCLQAGADRYQWTDLLGVYLKRARLWRQASLWAGSLLNDEREALEAKVGLGKAEGEAPDASPPSSSAPLPMPTRKTRNLPPAETSSSARLPTGSAP